MELALQLPNNYVEIEQEEMMYLDGGWSATMVANNVRGLAQRIPLRAVTQAGLNMATIKTFAFHTKAFIIAKFVTPIAKIALAVGGVIAGGLALLAGSILVHRLGTKRMFY